MNIRLFGICSSLLIIHTQTAASVFDLFSSLMGRFAYEDVVTKEYPVSQQATITIHATTGDIQVSSWKRPCVCVKAIKRAKKMELLPDMQSKEKIETTDEHTMLTINADETPQGKIDYTVFVPAIPTVLNLTTDYGAINVSQVYGPVIARTKCGAISVSKAYNTVTASTEESGNISIDDTKESIRAITSYGNINIKNAGNNVTAQARNKGNLTATYNQLPSDATVQLATQSGNITLNLPNNANATLTGNTNRGVLICEHQVTLMPQTTMLNRQAWARFKREVHATLGSGDAPITLSSTRGNIRITKASNQQPAPPKKLVAQKSARRPARARVRA